MRSTSPLLVVALAFATAGCGSGRGPAAPAPGWRERTVVALTNAVRVAPADWKARWSGGGLGAALGASYPAVPPLRWDAGLWRSSRAHSADMAATPCFQHDSCDGTRWSDRIHAWYTASGAIGENIAAGYGSPEAVVYGWICDGSAGGCAGDRSGADGHRANIMSAGWEALGAGWAAGGSGYGQYWTQDFGGKATLPASPLADGSHLVIGATLRLFANVWADAPPQGVFAVVDGARVPLAAALGSAARGTWAVELPVAAGCRQYAFELVDGAGRAWRHPPEGAFPTHGEPGCDEGP
jgi:hypothetical protein